MAKQRVNRRTKPDTRAMKASAKSAAGDASSAKGYESVESLTSRLMVSVRHRILASIVFVLVVVSVGMLVLDQLYRPSAFPVAAVHYSGYFHHVQPEELEAVVNPVVKGNLFALDLDRVKRRAESLAWIERVDVRRRWPGVVSVTVTEQKLIARWLPGGFINQHGAVVSLPITMLTQDLPALSGPSTGVFARDGSSTYVLDRYRRWGNMLAAAGLQVQQLVLDDSEVWHARVQLGRDALASVRPDDHATSSVHSMEIVIGRHDADYRLARFARMFPQALQNRFSEVDQIDLRYPNGFAVQWHGEPSSKNASQIRTAPEPSEGATRA